MLPAELSLGIAELNADIGTGEVSSAVEELSRQYRVNVGTRPQLTNAHRAAYLRVRLPATYAVISRVFREAELRIPELQIQSMLDLGAGPGTAMWAAAQQFSGLERTTLIEDSGAWIEIGKRLGARSGDAAIRSADWQQRSVNGDLGSDSYDLVCLSYVINELPASDQAKVALEAWKRTKKLLAIVEPGTPEGFANIRKVRHELIGEGAFLVAPCPHANQCPIGIGNWCHFSERVDRTSEHRSAKRGDLGYEDEKYSYVIFAREQVALPVARILRHPGKHSGHVDLELCTAGGLKKETISRKQGERYKIAKRAEWGEAL